MKIISKIVVLIATISLFSCQDVINLDLPEGEKLIVINGIVSDTIPVWAEVLQTANYNENGPLPVIEDASVWLFENNVKVSQLKLDSNVYRSNFVGTVGNTYFLQVEVPSSHPELGGTIWQSNEELLKATPPIDSIYQKWLPEDIFQDEGIYVFYHFTDPVGTGDRYRIKLTENDTVRDGAGDITVFEDGFFDGRSFNEEDLPAIQVNGSPAKDGFTFVVEHSGISLAYMNYLNLLNEQVAQVGGLFDPPPAVLQGNIYGITNPEKLGLGFFAATGLNYAEYTVVE